MYVIKDEENALYLTEAGEWTACDCGAAVYETQEAAEAVCVEKGIDPSWVIAK